MAMRFMEYPWPVSIYLGRIKMGSASLPIPDILTAINSTHADLPTGYAVLLKAAAKVTDLAL